MTTTNQHVAIMVLPFDIGDYASGNSPFDIDIANGFKKIDKKNKYFSIFNRNSKENSSVDCFRNEISKISEKHSKPLMDGTKYHLHLKKLLVGIDNDSNGSFLKYYKIKNDFWPSEVKIKIKNHPIEIKLVVITNEFAEMGYIIFNFIFNNGLKLNESEIYKFFRFYSNKEIKKGKHHLITLTENSEDGSIQEKQLSIEDILSYSYFKKIWPYIKFRHRRPVLLHLSNTKEIILGEKLNINLYNIIRTKNTENEQFISTDQNYVVTSGSGVSMCILNEGAFVLDPLRKGAQELINNYFPAFIFALNQREVMIKITQYSSNLSITQLRESKNETIAVLRDIKEKIELFKFKQLFYSVSFIDEIVVFYKQLQNSMNIDILLTDNKECVEEVVKRLEEIDQEKRDLWINATLSFIGCLGLFSFFKDLIPFATSDLETSTLGYAFINTYSFQIGYKLFTSLSPFLLFLVLLRIMRRK